MSWIVVGDSPKYEGCLVTVGFNTEEEANAHAEKLNNSPELREQRGVSDHTNFRAKHTTPEKEWWNDPFLAN